MKRSTFFTAVLLLSMSSCKVLSFFPLYTESKEHVVERSAIEGNYLSNDSSESVYIIGPELKSQLINKEYSIEGERIKMPSGMLFPAPWTQILSSMAAEGAGKEEPSYLVIRDNEPLLDPSEKPAIRADRFEFHGMHLVELDGKLYADCLSFSLSIDASHEVDIKLEGNDHVAMHTIAQVVQNGDAFELNFMDESFLKTLFEQNRARLEHVERDDQILLTAQPEDLQKFIIKFSDEEKAFSNRSQLMKIHGI